MKVLLLDNYDSFTYNIAQLLEESRLCDFDIIKNDKIIVEECKKYDKILLSPGAGIPSEAGMMMQVIKKYHKTKSIFGICLGMQAIANFFDGEIYNLQKVYHGKKTEITIKNSEPIFSNLPNKIEVGLYHSWAVKPENLPKSLQITSKSEQNIIMSLSHIIYNIKGVQFHPESYMTTLGKKIITNWLQN